MLCTVEPFVAVGLLDVDLVVGPIPPFTRLALPELKNTDALHVQGVAGDAPPPIRRATLYWKSP